MSEELIEVIGHKRELSDGRKVMVGWRKDGSPGYILAFVNAEGEKTRLSLSEDATDALRELLSIPRDPSPYWTLVEHASAEFADTSSDSSEHGDRG